MAIYSNKPSHLKALLNKNWILWKRSWLISILEILIPVAFSVVMYGLREASSPEDVPRTSFYNNPLYTFQYNGLLDAAALELIKDCNAGDNGGFVALAPATDSLVAQLNTILTNAGFRTMLFASNTAINTFTNDDMYGLEDDKNLCFGIVINFNNFSNLYSYSLRFNITRSEDLDIPNTRANRIAQLDRDDLVSLRQYGRNGFLTIQSLIDNLILQKETGNSNARITSTVTSKTVEAHIKDTLASSLQGFSRLFLDLPLILPYLRFVNAIIKEKEKRIREGMKIMGLTNTAFYLSWFITYFIIFTIISLLMATFLTVGVFYRSSFALIFFWHWLYSLCLMSMGFFISVFYNNAKRGNVVAFLVTLILGFLQSVASSTSPRDQLWRISFAPPTSLGLSADYIYNLESTQRGLTSENFDLEIYQYTMNIHYIVMAIDIVLFLVIGIYLDQVLPSDFGSKKHPLFCLPRKKRNWNFLKKLRARKRDTEENVSMLENPDNFEDVEFAMKAQDVSKKSIMVNNLRKVFPQDKVAVDGVSFSMYKNQIFALLGHNGAGKTTTISMITGMLNATKGNVSVFGYDNQTQIDEIRKFMGVCPQHDILFDKLTVKEHLELFAVFKGMNKKDIPAEVEKIINDIGLSEKRNYFAKNLSGGQKRRLSVGLAFIGGSKFILLDEPSSGMDSAVRRKLWEMLKNYKHNRVILLTTHLMDEADYLGDRIGIMTEGKLKCLGRSLFLKTRFGVGYNLTLVKKEINNPSQPTINLVERHIPKCKVISDVSAEISIQLSQEYLPRFKDLFEDLDRRLEQLKISSYGVSVTTLEEVFLNVAKATAPDNHFDRRINPGDSFDGEDLDDFDLKEHKIKNPWELFFTHFLALVEKRLYYFKRDKKSLVTELLLPVIIVIIGIINSSISIRESILSVPLVDTLYGNRFQVDYNSILPSTNTPIDPNFISYLNSSSFFLNPNAVNSVQELDQRMFEDQGQDVIYSPVNVFSFFAENLDNTTKQYEYTTLINTRAQEAAPFAMNKINNAILKLATGNPLKRISVTISPFLRTEGSRSVQNIYSGINYAFVFSIGMSFIPGSLIAYIVREREIHAKHQQIVSGVSLPAYWLANFLVDYFKYLIPAGISALLAMLFRALSLIYEDKLRGLWTLLFAYGFSMVPFTYLCSFLFKNFGSAQVAIFFFNFATGFIGGLTVSMLRLLESTRHIAHILEWIFRPLPTFALSYGFMNITNRDIYYIRGDIPSRLNVFDIRLIGGDILYLWTFGVIYTLLIFLVEKLKNKQSITKILSRENSVPYVPKKLDDDVEQEIKEIEESDNQTYAIKVDKLRKVYMLGRKKNKVAVDRLSFGVKNGECFALLGVNGAGKSTTFKILSGDIMATSGRSYINGFEIPRQLDDARQDLGYCPQYDALLECLTAKEHLFMYAALKGIPESIRERLVEKQLFEMNLKQYEDVVVGTFSGGNKRKLSVAIAMIGNPAIVFLDEPSTGMDPEARRFMWNVISKISRERKQSSVILTTHSMEEAEALATKLGIMVNGNLKCLGTCQHIKNKYGGGYELEIKLKESSRETIEKNVEALEFESEELIDAEKIDEVLIQLRMISLKDDINEHGSGSAIYTELKSTGKVTINLLVEWILTEREGEKLKKFLKESFGEMKLLEHFQCFYRFQAPSDVTVGRFFGILEDHKSQLNILQYSIKQSTIEQIFNAFAAEEDLHEKELRTAITIPLPTVETKNMI